MYTLFRKRKILSAADPSLNERTQAPQHSYACMRSRCKASKPLSVPGPGAQQPEDCDKLAQVVGVVVGHKQGLSEDRLTLAMRDRGEKVGCGLGDQIHHRFQISPKGRHGAVPGSSVRRGVSFGP